MIDGLRTPQTTIELAPRIRESDGHLVDDSYHAVEQAATQFYGKLTLEQLVMTTVALQVHMRKSRVHLERRKLLQSRWTELARKMKKARVEDEHLTFQESRWKERMVEASERSGSGGFGGAVSQVVELLEAEHQELVEQRRALEEEQRENQRQWLELEREDAQLLQDAPKFEQTDDLRHPYVLMLIGTSRETRPKRSLASAMNVLVEALQKPLSRTDQMLLEIALRRGIRASGPAREPDSEDWVRGLFREAERAFLEEFPWSRPYLSRQAD